MVQIYASCDVWKFGAYEVLQRRKVVMKKRSRDFFMIRLLKLYEIETFAIFN
jgi:hypothetical protein